MEDVDQKVSFFVFDIEYIVLKNRLDITTLDNLDP